MPWSRKACERTSDLTRTASFRLPPAAALLPALLPTLAACSMVDPEQARLCRLAVPALAPPGSALSVTAVRPASPDGVRVEYRSAAAGRTPAAGFALCRFDPAMPGRFRSITTEAGAVGDARLFLLQHYYVETPEAAAADPGTVGSDTRLPELPAPVAHLLQHVLVGLPGLAIYGLLAAAYGLLYGLVGRINLAFGAMAAVGAASIGVVAAGGAASPGNPAATLSWIALGLPVAAAAAALHNAVAGTASFVLVPARSSQGSLVASLGAAVALGEWLRIVGPRVPDWLPPVGANPLAVARSGSFLVTLTPGALLTAATGAAAAFGLLALMNRSRYGRSWRALADDGVGAALCGVDARRIVVATLLLSGALAGLAGALAAVQFGALGTTLGFALGLKALAAAVLGGLGTVSGALLGGVAIGIFEILWSAFGPLAFRDLAVDVILVAAVCLRPHGLLPDMSFARRGPMA